jgi:hypothetical protein
MSGQTLGIQYEKETDQDGQPVLDDKGDEKYIPSHPILIDISGGEGKT